MIADYTAPQLSEKIMPNPWALLRQTHAFTHTEQANSEQYSVSGAMTTNDLQWLGARDGLRETYNLSDIQYTTPTFRGPTLFTNQGLHARHPQGAHGVSHENRKYFDVVSNL